MAVCVGRWGERQIPREVCEEGTQRSTGPPFAVGVCADDGELNSPASPASESSRPWDTAPKCSQSAGRGGSTKGSSEEPPVVTGIFLAVKWRQ